MKLGVRKVGHLHLKINEMLEKSMKCLKNLRKARTRYVRIWTFRERILTGIVATNFSESTRI